VEANGHNGQIGFDGQFVTITRRGFLARASVGKGDTRIHISQIAAVEWKPAGPLVNGFIRFAAAGSVAPKSRSGNRTQAHGRDENSVIFTRQQRDAFEQIRDVIEQAMRQSQAESPRQPISALPMPPPREDRKIAQRSAKWAERLGTDRPDIIEAAARMNWTLGGKREIKHLTEHLLPGEVVRAIAQGTYREKQGVITLTDRRVLFLFHGFIGTAKEDFPLSRIASVSTSSILGIGHLTIHVGGAQAVISGVTVSDLEPLAEAIRSEMNRPDISREGPPAAFIQPVPALPNPSAQLRQLQKLHQEGLITDDEYQAKRAEVLRRI
jgi:hypothetical protein